MEIHKVTKEKFLEIESNLPPQKRFLTIIDNKNFISSGKNGPKKLKCLLYNNELFHV